MKIKPEGAGVVLTLHVTEADVLVNLFAEQSSELTDLSADDARWRRLHPDAFADAEQAADFRSMVEAELDALRLDRTGTCLAELAQAQATVRRNKVLLHLDDEATQRWMATLNDVRLMRGTALGVTAENSGRWDPGAPDFADWAAYHWLTGVQDALITAAMGT
jgi:hypothetical protein